MQEMSIRKAKTGTKDSLVIADVIRFGRYASSNICWDKPLVLKELCRNRSYLMDMACDLKRKTIAILDRVFLEYTDLDGLKNLTKLQTLVLPYPNIVGNPDLDPEPYDIQGLSGLTELVYLQMYAGVKDLTPLQNLTKLQTLYIYNGTTKPSDTSLELPQFRQVPHRFQRGI